MSALYKHAITAPYTATVFDYYLGCDSTGGPVAITLPPASTMPDGRVFIVKDEGGMAAANNIDIACNPLDTIEGAASAVMTVGRSSLTVLSDGISKWFVY